MLPTKGELCLAARDRTGVSRCADDTPARTFPADKQDRLRAVDPLEWQLRRPRPKLLQDVCLRMREAGVACEAQVNNGDAAEQIVDCARDREIGLVLIASHGQSGLSDWNSAASCRR